MFLNHFYPNVLHYGPISKILQAASLLYQSGESHLLSLLSINLVDDDQLLLHCIIAFIMIGFQYNWIENSSNLISSESRSLFESSHYFFFYK